MVFVPLIEMMIEIRWIGLYDRNKINFSIYAMKRIKWSKAKWSKDELTNEVYVSDWINELGLDLDQ